jgi:hypothetical protein
MVSKGLMADPFLTDAAADRKAAAGVGKAMVSAIKQKETNKTKQKEWEKSKQKEKVAVPPKPPALSPLPERKKNAADTKTKEKKQRKFPYRKAGDIEEEIFARETQIMMLNEDLLRPEIARDGERMKVIHQEIQAEQAKIALLYEHWEEANERNA